MVYTEFPLLISGVKDLGFITFNKIFCSNQLKIKKNFYSIVYAIVIPYSVMILILVFYIEGSHYFYLLGFIPLIYFFRIYKVDPEFLKSDLVDKINIYCSFLF
jgi:hypothetical protein